MKQIPKYISEQELHALVAENKGKINQYFDPDFVKQMIKQVFNLLDEIYFRSVFIGFQNFPERNNPDRPLIFASNHSGMAFPWDAIVFGGGFYKLSNYDMSKTVRSLAAPMLSQSALMNPFLIKNFWKRSGGVDATTLNFETLMQQNKSNVLIYPEGVPGIGKGFNRRYQLQKFSTSLLRMSIKYKTDIIPFATINGEYINPYMYSIKWINKLAQKIGIPFIPVGILTPFILIFPWLFYFAFPAKLTYVLGKRIKPYQMIDKPFEEITRAELQTLRDKLHREMQSQFDRAVAEFGKKPYRIKEFFVKAIKNISKFPYFLPVAWPLLFMEFERQYSGKDGGKVKLDLGFLSTFKIVIRNPMVIAYFIPVLGWIPILIRGYSNNKIKGG